MQKKLKSITLDQLAGMVASGFEGTAKSFEGVAKSFEEVNKRFNDVEDRLERIENLLHSEYKERIERLEDQVKELQRDYRQLIGFSSERGSASGGKK